MARELNRVAPTPGDKFALMLGQRPTPRTDAAANESIVKVYETSKQLEREVAEARGQIDSWQKLALSAEVLRKKAETERDNAESDRKQAEADTLRALHERNEARETIAEMETRHAAVMLHTQGVVDESNATRGQRDRLAAALRACREDSCELLGERAWWADEPRCDYRKRYDETAENIARADEALAAIEGKEQG